MAGAKETPRQKMIGMMYLVLTAMLALNVSRDILNSFVTMDESLVVTKVNFTEKNQIIYGEFEKAKAEDEKKVGEYFDKAMIVKNKSDELVNFIESARAELIHKLDGVPREVADTMSAKDISAKDNYDVPTHFLCGDDESKGSNGKANEIKEKILKYKEEIKNLLEEKDKEQVKLGLDMGDGYNPVTRMVQTWEIRNFYHNVAVAAVALLNKTIIEVRNAEAEVVSKLMEYIDAGTFKFDKIEAKVIPKSNYILSGSDYEADIFVAAYSSTQDPEVEIGNMDTATLKFSGEIEKIQGKDGKVKYVKKATGLGPQKYRGVINIQTPDGGMKPYPFSSEYFVARPSATISADKMNVMYRGIPGGNPVSISVPGVPSGEETISVQGATYKRTGAGKYSVSPSGGNKVTITVFAEIGEQRSRMGSQEFRVMNIPDPIPLVAGKQGGAITKSLLKAAPFVVAELNDFLFEGIKYNVTSFTFSTVINGLIADSQCYGNRLNAKAIGLVDRTKRGQKIYFEDIKAKGPDGRTRNLPSVILKLN